MKLYIPNETETYPFFNSYDDTWLLDYDYKKFLAHKISYEISTQTLVEVFCSHVNYWLNSDDYEKTNSNEVIKNSILKMKPYGDGNPELLIYDFNGKSVYDGLIEEKHELDDSKKEITLFYKDGEKLVCSIHDFENFLRGEIEEWDDENEIFREVYVNPTPLFFMKTEDQNKMRDYIFDFFKKMNEFLIKKIEIV